MTDAASGGSRLQHWVDVQRLRPAAPTRAWYGALAFGIAALLFGIRLAATFPATGAGFADGYGTPVIAFEFARGQAESLALFGPESDPLQVSRLAPMRQRSVQRRVGHRCVLTGRHRARPHYHKKTT